jgi:hypothetical protein
VSCWCSTRTSSLRTCGVDRGSDREAEHKTDDDHGCAETACGGDDDSRRASDRHADDGAPDGLGLGLVHRKHWCLLGRAYVAIVVPALAEQ